ncbi:major Facilitator Superfamily protein [Paecilomyces variotii No. 5]|uniref:Major Facilitator Superfamily protein n=1 Tax=Byssochlamys spectabilis (strain No. 5 / NBRC 109023) TaxID=1356009 RepID=V5FZR4_BYSSN|nr:major Facilitator Superfamily protein [Paecilomyces variotii No. 5]
MAETKEVEAVLTRDVETTLPEKGQVTDISSNAPEGIHTDVARHYFELSLQYDQAQLEKDAVKVRRKLDFMVLPMMMTTYMLSFLDKQTLNYSNAYGLQADTHMTGDDYSWVASALFFGWLIGAWPANVALQHFPVARLIGCIMFVWGALCMLQASAFNFSGLFAVRFFLGLTEACISPAWVLLTSMLWTRDEQPLRTSFWISTNGVSSILGALLSWGLGKADHTAVASWKLIYLVVGALTIIWGVVIFLFLPDGPHNGKMLSEYERVVAVWRISKNRTGVQHPKFLPYQVKEALLDPKTYILLLMAAAIGILNGGVVSFMSALIKGFGFSSVRSSLLQMPGGACEVVGCILLGYISTFKNMTGVTIILGCIPGIVGLAGIMTISIEHRYNLVACAWVQNIIGSPIVLSWTLPVLNVAGHTKRSTVLGLYFLFYCAGQIAGPHLFFAREAPRYMSAIKGLETCYAAFVVLQIIYMSICFLQNKNRDRQGYHAQDEQEAREGFEDLTDWENQHFRYRL